MDPVESAARDDMERLHSVSRDTLIQAARTGMSLAEAVLHLEAERARHAQAAGREATMAQREHARTTRDAAAAVWETRLRDPQWFTDAPIQDVMDTWASAEAWAQAGDARAIAARERLRLQVQQLGLDPDLVAIAVDDRDVRTLTDLFQGPGVALDPETDRSDQARDGRDRADDGGPARRRIARGGGVSQDVEEMTAMVRETLHPEVTEMVLGDKNWPRVAGQLNRAKSKIDDFNRANPSQALDLRDLLVSLQDRQPRGTLRTPAGWLIWQLHNASAARGVTLVEQTRPRGTAGRPRRRTATSPRARTPSRIRQTSRPDVERD
ncbi:MAG: hypothetical protein QG597_171 [Actinomycetota bacterium]|nr:hypothetical protein [Actinomycetota bacterium]